MLSGRRRRADESIVIDLDAHIYSISIFGNEFLLIKHKTPVFLIKHAGRRLGKLYRCAMPSIKILLDRPPGFKRNVSNSQVARAEVTDTSFMRLIPHVSPQVHFPEHATMLATDWASTVEEAVFRTDFQAAKRHSHCGYRTVLSMAHQDR
jgi:hypothetical protein